MNNGRDGDNKTGSKRYVISDFYHKDSTKGKPENLKPFLKLGYLRTVINQKIARVDAGESVERREGQGCPQRLTEVQEL